MLYSMESSGYRYRNGGPVDDEVVCSASRSSRFEAYRLSARGGQQMLGMMVFGVGTYTALRRGMGIPAGKQCIAFRKGLFRQLCQAGAMPSAYRLRSKACAMCYRTCVSYAVEGEV
jgi:hypothetical protein